MPCYLTGTAEGDARFSEQEARKELLQVTRLLCKACKHLELHRNLPQDVAKWWKKHKKIDAHRERVL